MKTIIRILGEYGGYDPDVWEIKDGKSSQPINEKEILFLDDGTTLLYRGRFYRQEEENSFPEVTPAVGSQEWEDAMMCLIRSRKNHPTNVIQRGTLWTSNSTGRRGVILWATEKSVCLSFNEDDIKARSTYSREDFTRLYSEV